MAKMRKYDPPRSPAGSWGMLVVGSRTAQFLWFRDPREMLFAVLDCASPLAAVAPPEWSPPTGAQPGEEEAERLNALTLVAGLVKDLNRRERATGCRVSWWGPMADLLDSRASVPAMIRTWFRQTVQGFRGPAKQGDGPILAEDSAAFAEFLDRVSFRADEFGDE